VILSTSTVRPRSPEQAETLADMGYTHVLMRVGFEAWTQDPAWRAGAEAFRAAGVKVQLIWPCYGNWSESYGSAITVDDPHYSFRAYDGRTNTTSWQSGIGIVAQFSHWNDTVERALVADLPRWLNEGPEIDGVHVNVANADRVFPSDWYPLGVRAMEGTEMFWSFDDHAQRKWAAASGGAPMPTHAHPNAGPEMRRFYRWYQGGWIDRLIALTDAVLDMGLTEVSTWWLPHTYWNEVNMSHGGAGSIEALERWRWPIIASGGHPLLMVGSLFGIAHDWPHWHADGVESITRACAPPHNWDVIVGVEADIHESTAAENIRHHGKLLSEMGASGMLCGGEDLWLGTQYEAEVAEAITTVRPLFGESKS